VARERGGWPGPVTDVYVDLSATALGGDDMSLDPESVRVLSFLAESGLPVILVSGGDSSSPEEVAQRTGVDAAAGWKMVSRVPMRPDAPSWYLTSDVDRCTGSTARLRTVLIGAAPPAASVRRCDSVARDVQAAVMEILAAEAMPSKL
jgi:hypothetical protein